MTQGQVMGLSGQTGMAGGDHIHFAMQLDNRLLTGTFDLCSESKRPKIFACVLGIHYFGGMGCQTGNYYVAVFDVDNQNKAQFLWGGTDMMNIYNGVAKLDAHGAAWITLPNYFEALNRDFRY